MIQFLNILGRLFEKKNKKFFDLFNIRHFQIVSKFYLEKLREVVEDRPDLIAIGNLKSAPNLIKEVNIFLKFFYNLLM